MALLETSNLHVRFKLFEGISHVLNGVNLKIERGERVAIVGESGCGKSLTIRAMLGLLRQRNVAIEGGVRFDGTELLSLPERSWRTIRGRRISMIFQDLSAALNPTFTVGDQLLKVIIRGGSARGKRHAREIARTALRQVAITDPDRVLHSYPFQLSGGLAQRVLITMALVNKPDLVLADEPTGNLDSETGAAIVDLMFDIQARDGSTLLLITHDDAVAERCKRIVQMNDGRLHDAPTGRL